MSELLPCSVWLVIDRHGHKYLYSNEAAAKGQAAFWNDKFKQDSPHRVVEYCLTHSAPALDEAREREAFEAWAKGIGFKLRKSKHGLYVDHGTFHVHTGWLAAKRHARGEQ